MNKEEKNYLVTFTPLEPYFFGNEKTFAFKGEDGQGQKTNSYFISSEQLPMQTTILGALRFLHLKEKTHKAAAEAGELIGCESFVIESKGKQSFGDIAELSPIFFVHTEKSKKELYVITPADHNADKKEDTGEKEANIKNIYRPFEKYDSFETLDGIKKYTKEYNAKADHSMSVMSIETSDIKDCPISSTVRTGNAKWVDKGGFFKKEFCVLDKGWSFAVAAKLCGDWETGTFFVYLGQNKSLFSVTIEESPYTEEVISNKIKKWIPSDVCYVWGDSYVTNAVYQRSSFAIADTREYREFSTNSGIIKKGGKLYSLIKSGSIFKTDDTASLGELFENKQCRTIGFNKIIVGGKKS